MKRPDSILGGPRGQRRELVRLATERLVEMEPPAPGRSLPLTITPAATGLDLAAWLRNHGDRVLELLLAHGAILFRGFGVDSPASFERTIGGLAKDLLEYDYRSTPRTRVSGRIFTSTEYPPDRSIPLHNEMSYTRSWPMKLWLCCVKTARIGGETPIADSRRIYARIPPAIRERFTERGVMYARNYGHGVDLPWQEVFQTSDKTEVERQCREAGIELEWKSGDRLSTRQVCQGTARHPVTGASVWFNQAHLFHVSSLADDERDLLVQTLGEESLPRNAFYGDGLAIEPESFLEIRRAIAEETISFPWKEGDVLLVDNMLAAHGRNPYQGERKILVGMTELHGGSFPGLER